MIGERLRSSDWRRFVRPARFVRLVKGISHRLRLGGLRPWDWRYDRVRLSENEIEAEGYKNLLGGGKEQWVRRGRFQLEFLRDRGLETSSRLLDVGCGPIRGGTHFVEFLDSGNYHGVDSNPDFVHTARRILSSSPLKLKNPSIEVSRDFELPSGWRRFDFGLAFSVLNHCGEDQRTFFFRNVPGAMRAGGRIYISHAYWFQESYLKDRPIDLTRTFGPREYDLIARGWGPEEKVFPIIELTVR
ncbi:MAG: class I SAM-dependent methyltransferase [Deltaproteobacteria bacterium]|nr:class I SAM-dependent methyltransferase [Deltaproteobacteria bacterium]